ncbi:hypothetical protein H1R20_g13856, partial [Candolleomyces eurysporus]
MKQPYEDRVNALYELQAENIDLILWVDDTATRTAWPCKDDGTKVHERDVCDWLRERNLVWTCLCEDPFSDGKAIAVIEHEEDGDTYLRCAQTLNPCQFFMNLTAIRRATAFTDTFDLLVENQGEAEYSNAIHHDGAWCCAEDEMGVEDVEATYTGWCGFYEPIDRQLENGNV